jgi:uncharacterized protein YecE (DUF72 family)
VLTGARAGLQIRVRCQNRDFEPNPMQMFVGTSGYSYKEWKGSFYPEKIAAGDMLRFYASHFRTVEINNTFYRMPDEGVLSRWADEVPEAFAFSLKAPQRISHQKRLREAESDVAEFLRRAAALKTKLGPMLFQLPPYLRKDIPRLQAFLGLVPGEGRVAFEFRHDSWLDDSVYEVLRAHGTMLCIADKDEGETPLVATSGSGYVRLRRTEYADAELAKWVEQIATQPWERVYVYFKHEDEGLGAKFGQRFEELWKAANK